MRNNQKGKKSKVLLIVAITLTFVLAGFVLKNTGLNNTANSKGIPVTYETLRLNPPYPDIKFPIAEKISTNAELVDLFKGFSEISTADNYIETTLNKYTDSYLANKGLVVIILFEPSSSISHSVEKVVYDDSILQVNINRYIPEAGVDSIAHCVFLIELDHDVFSQVSEVKYNGIDLKK